MLVSVLYWYFQRVKYTYLVAGHGVSILFHKLQVVDIASDGGWDSCVKGVISNGRKKVNQLHRNINVSARKQLLLSVLRPTVA